jgi:hypothetical protein
VVAAAMTDRLVHHAEVVAHSTSHDRPERWHEGRTRSAAIAPVGPGDLPAVWGS